MSDDSKKIAKLESFNDFLQTELSYLDQILRECGFPEGINSLKETVEELISDKQQSSKDKGN